MLPLQTAHGAIHLLAKQTFQTHRVKAKRALVVVQCCEEKCFFPDTGCTPGTAPALPMGYCCAIPGGGTGPFPRGQLDGLDVAGHSPPLPGDNRDLDGFITLGDSSFCRRHCTQLCGLTALGSETALEEEPQSDQASLTKL